MMSAEKYVKAAVENVNLKLAKINCRLTSHCDTHMATVYHPSDDVTKEMNVEVLQLYQDGVF